MGCEQVCKCQAAAGREFDDLGAPLAESCPKCQADGPTAAPPKSE